MRFQFPSSLPPEGIARKDWLNWSWQMRASLKSEEDFAKVFALTEDERAAFTGNGEVFSVRCTPYYASLADKNLSQDPLRRILMPNRAELVPGVSQMLDPLGERQNSPAPRIVHRYPDRALFLVTDTCSVYCRYCTRKHFTGADQAMPKAQEYEQSLNYLKSKKGLREVILSGGDPLTLGDQALKKILSDLRQIEHIELIRIGSRMPVVNPMRITQELVQMIREFQPVYLMTHFNHPRELTAEAAQALSLAVDHGIPVFNQMVLLNGINNSAEIVQALSRRLLFLRVKPYYMFQCDPSLGTDHLRTSIDDSLSIQRELWGNLSGLAMPSLSVDIPEGGGKVALVPNFAIKHAGDSREFKGWDGIRAKYLSPAKDQILKPIDSELYSQEWQELKDSLSSKSDI